MRDYLSKVKSISNNLNLVGSPLSLTDLVTRTLAGLDTEYTPIVVILSEKENLSWADLQSKLLTFESRLEQLNTTTTTNLSSAFANLTFQPNSSQSCSPNYRGTGGRRGRGRSNRSFSGGRTSSGGRGAPKNNKWCYLCDKLGHEVQNCFKMFDRNFKPPHKPNNASAYITTPETIADPT